MYDKSKADNLITDGYAAVILAAGYSSRMKTFKPLLPVGEMTAIERLIAEVKNAGIKNVVAVTGHNREKLGTIFDTPEVMEAYNDAYAEGMFASIKTGIIAAKNLVAGVKGIILMPVDCPLISSNVICNVIQNANSDDFCVPTFEGKKGHPLYIPEKYFDEICGYDGPGGLKGVTDKYRDNMKRVPVDEEGCIMDMDTPEGYEEIIKYLAAGCRRTSLAELAKGRRIWLVRHGQTRRHDEKMFIGRYDVPLADDAGDEIYAMARRLAEELGVERAVKRIYTSPLKRAFDTAGMLRDVLNKEAELCIVEDLQEIALGKWDGKPVREVKELYPEEYVARGKNIFAFKVGNKAENFYDVQYRAVKAIRGILETDCACDIVVVSHSAVIRALENNLKGRKVDDSWENVNKGQYRRVEL